MQIQWQWTGNLTTQATAIQWQWRVRQVHTHYSISGTTRCIPPWVFMFWFACRVTQVCPTIRFVASQPASPIFRAWMLMSWKQTANCGAPRSVTNDSVYACSCCWAQRKECMTGMLSAQGVRKVELAALTIANALGEVCHHLNSSSGLKYVRLGGRLQIKHLLVIIMCMSIVMSPELYSFFDFPQLAGSDSCANQWGVFFTKPVEM